MLSELFSGAGGAIRDRLRYRSDWSMRLQPPGSENYLGYVLLIFDPTITINSWDAALSKFLGLGATRNSNGTRICGRIESLGANPAMWLG